MIEEDEDIYPERFAEESGLLLNEEEEDYDPYEEYSPEERVTFGISNPFSDEAIEATLMDQLFEDDPMPYVLKAETAPSYSRVERRLSELSVGPYPTVDAFDPDAVIATPSMQEIARKKMLLSTANRLEEKERAEGISKRLKQERIVARMKARESAGRIRRVAKALRAGRRMPSELDITLVPRRQKQAEVNVVQREQSMASTPKPIAMSIREVEAFQKESRNARAGMLLEDKETRKQEARARKQADIDQMLADQLEFKNSINLQNLPKKKKK